MKINDYEFVKMQQEIIKQESLEQIKDIENDNKIKKIQELLKKYFDDGKNNVWLLLILMVALTKMEKKSIEELEKMIIKMKDIEVGKNDE